MTTSPKWLCARCPRTAGFSGALATRDGRVKTACSVNARNKSHLGGVVTELREEGK